MKLIPLDAVLAVIEKRLGMLVPYSPFDKGGMVELQVLKDKLNYLEVKEVDLEHLEQEVKDFCYKFDDRKDKWYDMTPHNKNIMVNPTWSNFAMQLAKHFFELGLKAQKL